jgi:hypothetical protein
MADDRSLPALLQQLQVCLANAINASSGSSAAKTQNDSAILDLRRILLSFLEACLLPKPGTAQHQMFLFCVAPGL